MPYELAKELKDAGFPQQYPPVSTAVRPLVEAPYSPTLEELIEACVPFSVNEKGDFHLERNPFDGSWGASIDCFKNEDYITGATPTVAVANLWLALNPKLTDTK